MKRFMTKLWRCLSTLIVAFVTIGICFSMILSAYIYNISLDDFSINNISSDTVPKIYDMDGNELYSVYEGEKEGTNRTQHTISIENLPKHVKLAFVAAEDKRFYEHNGFDIIRITSAVINAIKNNGKATQGASTISQQLVKLYTRDTEHTLSRKFREIGHSISIERQMSKDQILEAYLNIAYFGNNAYGIYDASKTFFGKEPSDLTIAEAASLAGKLKYPNSSDPLSENRTYFLSRKDYVLGEMYSNGFITEEEYTSAISENLNICESDSKSSYTSYTNLALSEAYELIINHYLDNGIKISLEDAKAIIRNPNTKIYTNLDTSLHEDYYKYMTNYLEGKEGLMSTFILTTKDGKVRAFYGQINNSIRAPGSTMKLIADYAPAFELGILTPDSIILDAPIENGFNPKNFSNSYSGKVTVRAAIASSLNTCAVRAFNEVGIKESARFIEKFGITSIDFNTMGPSVAIGCYGVSPYEMTQAYNTFNNDGKISKLSFIDKIILEDTVITPESKSTLVITSAANDMVRDCLKAAVVSGTCKAAALENRETYAKSGTTDDAKDYWVCGFTDDVTASIWMGYETPRELEFKSTEAKKLWKDLVSMYYP